MDEGFCLYLEKKLQTYLWSQTKVIFGMNKFV